MPGARDGQLRVHRGTDSPPWALQMFDDDLGLWLTLAQADVEEDAMQAGIPILRGPYVVDFSDIPHDGDTLTLWTPQVGDVLLRIFADWQTATQWDSGRLALCVGTPFVGNMSLALAINGHIDRLDMVFATADDDQSNALGNQVNNAAHVCHTTDPICMAWQAEGDADPTQGHVALYALVARAVAP